MITVIMPTTPNGYAIAEKLGIPCVRQFSQPAWNKEFIQKREDLAKHMAELDKEIFRLESTRNNYEESSEKQMNYRLPSALQ